jgi:DNA-directed RNA polymerase subunit RPC12/RpoP
VPVDDEEFIIWQDVFDQLAAKRGDLITCPHCGHKPLTVEESAEGITRISCPSCQRFIEGRLGLG